MRHTTASTALDRAAALEECGKRDEALASAIEAIETDTEYLSAHEWLAECPRRWTAGIQGRPAEASSGLEASKPQLIAALNAIEQQYESWEKRFPGSLGVTYGIATLLFNRKSPRAHSYLLKLAERDATNAKVFAMLAGDAAITGNMDAIAEYMEKAMQLEPGNPQYAYAYAYNLQPPKRESALVEVVRRFPMTWSSALALQELAYAAGSDSRGIPYLEELRAELAAGNAAAAGGLPMLFEIYLRSNPDRAVALAQEMQSTGPSQEWGARAELAQAFIDVSKLLAAGHGREAAALVSRLQPEPRSANAGMLERMKARVMVAAGEVEDGYRALLNLQAIAPEDETLVQLEAIATQLHKTPAEVRADVTTTLYAGAKAAPPFDLQRYASEEKLTLAGLRGKAVLLKFWFAGCGPCAREFPHFEAAMRRVSDRKDIAYIGINVANDQDALVLSTIAKNRYTFSAVKGSSDVRNAYAVDRVPANFLIDRHGKIVYSGFRIDDARGEAVLERMIESTLSHDMVAS